MKNSWLMKVSFLSISLVLTSTGAISANIPLMAKAFPEQSSASVEMLTTIPAFMVVIFVFLSGFIAKKIGQKETIVAGLIIALVSGMIPAFTTSFTIIMLSRAGLGIGFGLFNSLAVSMIGELFSDDERATLIGCQSAFQGLGAAFMTFLAGQLLRISWQATFWVYLLIIPIIVLFVLFVPKPEKKKAAIITSEKKQTFNKAVVGYAFFLFFVIIIFTAIFIRLSSFVTTKDFGTVTDASNILGFMQIASMLAGFAFGMVYKWVNKYTLPVSLIILGIGYMMISISNSIVFVGIGVILAGIAFSLLLPYLFNQVSLVSPKGSETFSTSLLLIGANLGSFLSPYGVVLLERFGSAHNDAGSIFTNGAIIFLSISVVGFITIKIKDKKLLSI